MQRWKTSTKYLEQIVFSGTLGLCDGKVQALKELKRSQTQSQLCGFLELFKVYFCIVKGNIRIRLPLKTILK